MSSSVSSEYIKMDARLDQYMASSNPLPAQTDDDEGVFEVDGVFVADDVLRRELEQARTCYLRNKPNYFCILCRTRYHEKQIVLSHLIPHSVLKS